LGKVHFVTSKELRRFCERLAPAQQQTEHYLLQCGVSVDCLPVLLVLEFVHLQEGNNKRNEQIREVRKEAKKKTNKQTKKTCASPECTAKWT
jgi:hypothetical protein